MEPAKNNITNVFWNFHLANVEKCHCSLGHHKDYIENEIIEGNIRDLLIHSGRRSGKSYLASYLALVLSQNKKERVLVIGLGLRILAKIFDIIMGWSSICDLSARGSGKKSIETKEGGSIHFITSRSLHNQITVRGGLSSLSSYTTIIADEYFWFSKDIRNEIPKENLIAITITKGQSKGMDMSPNWDFLKLSDFENGVAKVEMESLVWEQGVPRMLNESAPFVKDLSK